VLGRGRGVLGECRTSTEVELGGLCGCGIGEQGCEGDFKFGMIDDLCGVVDLCIG